MRTMILAGSMTALLLATAGWAANVTKDEDRLRHAGTVLTESGAAFQVERGISHILGARAREILRPAGENAGTSG